jgi:hypothetical protein
MAGRRGALTGRCQGCNHPERVRIERFLAAGASIKGAARKFAIDYHALRRHWRNHVSAEARATYVAGARAAKDQLEAIVANESLGLIDHYRIVSLWALQRLYRGCRAGRQQFLGAVIGAAAREFPGLRATNRRAAAWPAAEYPEQRPGQSRLHASDRPDRQCGGALSGSARSRDRGAARSRCRERFAACAYRSSR